MRLHNKFSSWLEKWRAEHVTADQVKECSDWLMGHGEGNKPCRTACSNQNKLNKPPYYPYNKYTVDYPEQQPKHPVSAE